MTSTGRCWLLLEKSDETRISKGIDGYKDRTGESYQYDSLVPNHKNLSTNDVAVLRKEGEILGVGTIGNIKEEDDTKIHRRCPTCNSTDVRQRSTKVPEWKCGKCSVEFVAPKETIVGVRTYLAKVEGFARLNSSPSVKDVKRCSLQGDGVSSQLSIQELDAKKVSTLFEGIDALPARRPSRRGSAGQGFGLSQPERLAVEKRAMHLARESYEDDGWAVIDVSASHPFDLLATKDKAKRFVEVKGTTGKGTSIILTHGEVKHVKSHPSGSALVVVAEIQLEKVGGRWFASGGVVVAHSDPWRIKASRLQPTQFKYVV